MTGSTWQRRVAVAASALVLLGVAACGGGGDASNAKPPTTGDEAWDAIVKAAYDEGKVNVYNAGSKEQNKRLAEAFEKKYPGIELSLTTGATELPERVSAELANGTDGADVLMFSDPNWFVEHEADLAPIDGPEAEGWNKDWWAVPGKSVLATALPWSMLVWNTNTFPDGFKTYEDLLDPQVKGKLGIRSQVSPSIAGYLAHLETNLGADYLAKLGEHDPKFYPSSIPLMQAVASGEVGVSNLGVPATVADLKKSGAPIDFAYAEPGFAYSHGASAFTKSKRPNAGRVFIDFLMSKEGQTAYNGEGQGGSARDDVEDALSMDGYSMLDTTKFSDPKVIAEWKSKFATYFE